MSRVSILLEISEEIKRNGFHITIVTQGICPRYLYTVGLKDKLGFDLLLPGCSKFYPNELISVISQVVNEGACKNIEIEAADIGEFCLGHVDRSWVELLALAAIDYYGEATPFMQIMPDKLNCTIDTPDLSNAWSATSEPVWQWLKVPWPFPVPHNSSATTNLLALRGAPVTEAARWEHDEWELFAGSGPDTPAEDIRVMPLATMVGYDGSISEAVELQVGKAVWRDINELCWHAWEANR